MNNPFENLIIFGKKSFSDLLKDIYNNQKKTESQIMDMVMALKPFITTAGDAVIIVPLIKEYMEVKVKNDEHLVKMAAIVQRAINSNASSSSSELILSDEEQRQLLAEVKSIGESQQKMINESGNITS